MSMDMASPSMSFMSQKKSSSSSFALTSLLRHKTTKSSIAVLFFFSVALLFTNSWFVHSEQVSVQQKDNYQVYDFEQLQLLEYDPEYAEAAKLIADEKCSYLLSACKGSCRPADPPAPQQTVLAKKEEKSTDYWPSFDVGNWVYLCAEANRTYRDESGMVWSSFVVALGPFEIIERVGVLGHDSRTATSRYNYKLDMPSVLNYLHPVFHGSMLEMENVIREKLGHYQPPGYHRFIHMPCNASSCCRFFRPEEINNNIARKVHGAGDSFMSIMTSIALCVATYILLRLLRAARRLILRK